MHLQSPDIVSSSTAGGHTDNPDRDLDVLGECWLRTIDVHVTATPNPCSLPHNEVKTPHGGSAR